MTLNNCASMKLEVHFQCKQVSHGRSGVLWHCGSMKNSRHTQTTCKTSSSILGTWGVQTCALLQPRSCEGEDRGLYEASGFWPGLGAGV